MRLVTIRSGARTAAARVDGDTVTELPARDVGVLLADPAWRDGAAATGGTTHDLAAVDLAPVVPTPGKIVCLGLNYESHILEMGRERPRYPTLFAKFAGALIGPRDPIALPSVSDEVDWEAELALVIGSPARHVDAGDALDHIAGYTVMNDVTVRDWQHRTREFLSGKTFESTSPLGPDLVTTDELPPGGAGLRIRCAVDGEEMQSASTDDLVFGAAEIVAYVSQIITLEPGDVIATGTPGGVGAGRDPRVFLRPGQVLTTEVEGIGTLVNECRRSPAGRSSRPAST